MNTTIERNQSGTGTIGEVTSNLPVSELKSKARDIVKNILPTVKHDPLFHVWNELNAQSINDPSAKYIVDMVNSRSFPLQAFIGNTLSSFYGGEGNPGSTEQRNY